MKGKIIRTVIVAVALITLITIAANFGAFSPIGVKGGFLGCWSEPCYYNVLGA